MAGRLSKILVDNFEEIACAFDRSVFVVTVENHCTYLDKGWTYPSIQGCIQSVKFVTYERLRCLNPLVRPSSILEVLEFVPGMQY